MHVPAFIRSRAPAGNYPMTSLDILEQRLTHFGNYYQKYLQIIKKHNHSLITALKESRQLMRVHIWRSGFAPSEEMKIIARLSEDQKTKVHHLSCYYALQFLHMNFRYLDVLSLDVASDTSSQHAYHRFLMNMGLSFRELTSAYIDNLLNIYLAPDEQPEFFLMSVGTRVDQDDIDLGIITKDQKKAEALNRAFQKITQDMLVFATPLHLHLSENVGKHVYTTTIEEYESLLNRKIQDVVIISEILNGRLIMGSRTLFEEFNSRIIDKYFYKVDGDHRFHEGFIRGILGEARALLISPPQSDAIAPKYDAIRISKSIIYAKKTIYGLTEVNVFDIIEALIKEELHHKTEYETLFKATAFLEMFKFMLQLHISQDEKFRLEEIDERQLMVIADRMGYRSFGMVSAWDQLIIDYYRNIKEVRQLCDYFIDDINVHLKHISSFKRMFDKQKKAAADDHSQTPLALDIIHQARFFSGVKYWEDALDILEDSKDDLQTFIASFELMSPLRREHLINAFVTFAQFSQITMLRMLAILGRAQKNMIGHTLYSQMNIAYLNYVRQLDNTLERWCRVFSYYPRYIHQYLQYLPESHFEMFEAIIAEPVPYDELKAYYKQLVDLFHIHRWSSKYFHRFFNRIISDHTEYLSSLNDLSELYKISSGLLGMVDIVPNTGQKKKILGDYYDLEFLRVGIGTMRGEELSVTNREFTNFCDNYMQKLYDTCAEEVEEEMGHVPIPAETFAILAAGGHARGQAYDDDYDLIAVTDTEATSSSGFAKTVVARMNREILKRGLLPHYRLGEILGQFVCPINAIQDYLQQGSEESFIDLSQLLGARLIVGSEQMETIVREKILEPLIFNNANNYIRRMRAEIESRHQTPSLQCDEQCNLKEAPGGLRDIEAIALMLKALSRTTIALNQNFLLEMQKHFPQIEDDLHILYYDAVILRSIRNLYRITEAAEDHIYPAYLNQLAVIFKQNNRPELSTPELIYNKIQRTLSQSAAACSHIMEFIETQI
ncbi:MAG: hypothetical protein GF313_02420 [Caldithrix sp.]|nr:hypothetical protein [Caldithrix sp.]